MFNFQELAEDARKLSAAEASLEIQVKVNERIQEEKEGERFKGKLMELSGTIGFDLTDEGMDGRSDGWIVGW